ncbi:MAG TPA: hypothetical protein PLV45_17315, partial [bacterium]|nr:hypothetical protein [bacterium]
MKVYLLIHTPELTAELTAVLQVVNLPLDTIFESGSPDGRDAFPETADLMIIELDGGDPAESSVVTEMTAQGIPVIALVSKNEAIEDDPPVLHCIPTPLDSESTARLIQVVETIFSVHT